MIRKILVKIVVQLMILSIAAVSSALAQSAPQSTSWNGRIFRAEGTAEISHSQLIEELSVANNIVIGEKPYVPEVQNTEAAIISGVTQFLGRQNRFTTAWEFLNFTDQELIRSTFARYVAGEINALDFFVITQGDDNSATYIPIIKSTKDLGGQFIGVNVSRMDRAIVAKKGIGAVNPALLPPGFDYGSPGYHERFVEFMSVGGHATPEKIQNYYAAQCLTDDAMAYHMLTESSSDLRFLVAGSFHTNYFDGAVGRLKIRAPEQITKTVTIIDAVDYTEAELLDLIHDPKYGDIADYVYFVNEPGTAPDSE